MSRITAVNPLIFHWSEGEDVILKFLWASYYEEHNFDGRDWGNRYSSQLLTRNKFGGLCNTRMDWKFLASFLLFFFILLVYSCHICCQWHGLYSSPISRSMRLPFLFCSMVLWLRLPQGQIEEIIWPESVWAQMLNTTRAAKGWVTHNNEYGLHHRRPEPAKCGKLIPSSLLWRDFCCTVKWPGELAHRNALTCSTKHPCRF